MFIRLRHKHVHVVEHIFFRLGDNDYVNSTETQRQKCVEHNLPRINAEVNSLQGELGLERN